jgi:hypothetical protein
MMPIIMCPGTGNFTGIIKHERKDSKHITEDPKGKIPNI